MYACMHSCNSIYYSNIGSKTTSAQKVINDHRSYRDKKSLSNRNYIRKLMAGIKITRIYNK